jgi:hypothetical protein
VPFQELKRRAPGTRRFALRTVHQAVNHTSIFITEQAGESNGTSLKDEFEVARDLSPTRQGAPQSCDLLYVAAQFNFFREKPISGGAIFGTHSGNARCSWRQVSGRMKTFE